MARKAVNKVLKKSIAQRLVINTSKNAGWKGQDTRALPSGFTVLKRQLALPPTLVEFHQLVRTHGIISCIHLLSDSPPVTEIGSVLGRASAGRNSSLIYSEICHGKEQRISLHSHVPPPMPSLHRDTLHQGAWPLLQATITAAALPLPQGY